MRAYILMAVIVFTSTAVWADKIYLKDGKVMEGQVVNKDSVFMTIQAPNGIPDKILVDDVDRVVTAAEENQMPPFKVDPSAFPNIGKKKLDLIVQLLQTNGTRDTMEKNFQMILAKIPPDQKAKMRDLLKTDEILVRLIPLYDKYFSEPELLQLIQFYMSPIGRKILQTMPQVLNESVFITTKYFEEKLKSKTQ